MIGLSKDSRQLKAETFHKASPRLRLTLKRKNLLLVYNMKNNYIALTGKILKKLEVICDKL